MAVKKKELDIYLVYIIKVAKPRIKTVPPNMSPPGACSSKIALIYNVKQLNQYFIGKFTCNYKASPIKLNTDFPP